MKLPVRHRGYLGSGFRVQGLGSAFRIWCAGASTASAHSQTCGVGAQSAGLVFKAHKLVHHSTLGLRVIKKEEVQGLG